MASHFLNVVKWRLEVLSASLLVFLNRLNRPCSIHRERYGHLSVISRQHLCLHYQLSFSLWDVADVEAELKAKHGEEWKLQVTSRQKMMIPGSNVASLYWLLIQGQSAEWQYLMLWIIPRPRSPCSMWLVCKLDPSGPPVMCFTHSECTFSHMFLVSILSLLSFQKIHAFDHGLFNIQVGKLPSPLCYLYTSNTRWQGLNERGDASPLQGQGISPFITEHCMCHLTNLTALWLLSELVYMACITILAIKYVPRLYWLFCSL